MLSCRLLQCLRPVKTFSAKECSETGLAMHSSNHVRTNKLWKYLSYEVQVFFKNGRSFMYILKMKKMKKKMK